MGFNTWNLYGCGVSGQLLMDTVIWFAVYEDARHSAPAFPFALGPSNARPWPSGSRLPVCQQRW